MGGRARQGLPSGDGQRGSSDGSSPWPLPFFFIISAMSPVMSSVSFQNGDKWRLSCAVLRGHLLFISMMGKMPWLIKKNCGLPTANPQFLISPAPQSTPHWGGSPTKILRGQETRYNDITPSHYP